MENETKKQDEAKSTAKKQLAFPQLIGQLVESVVTQRSNMGEARNRLVAWYRAQDPDHKQDVAKQLRKDLETLRQVAEGLHAQAIEMTMSDV